MKKGCFIFLVCTSLQAAGQTGYTGRNICLIEIITTRGDYRFSIGNMSAHLNNSLGRFEFIIPLGDVKAMPDSAGLRLFERLTEPGDAINISAALPDDKDEELNLAVFKGNGPIMLPGEIRIGRYTFDNMVSFKGMLMAGDQKMAFDFMIVLTTPSFSESINRNETIKEIKIYALGDKIIGLTSN